MSEPERLEEGRLSAAFFASALLLLLTGCSLIRPPSPLPADIAQKAAELPYASIHMQLGRREGLLVLAYAAHQDTWFLTPDHASFLLRDGYLSQTDGMPQELLMTQFRRDQQTLTTPPWQQAQAGVPFQYQVLREWRDGNSHVHADQANARLLCEPDAHDISLPLITLPLQSCTETLTWSDGRQTRSILWRNPADNRLWQVQTQPWPGAPQFEWQVAKSWW